MKSLILYDKKEDKIKSDKISEYDLDELESLIMFRHGEEFLKIPESKIGKHTVLESFALNNISWWWFAAPTIHPKYKDAMLFIDRLNILLDENSFEILKLKGCFNKLEIIQKICKNKKIKLEVSKNEYYIYSKKLQLKNLIKKNAYKKINSNKLKKRLDVFKKTSKYTQPSPGYVLITSPGVYRRKSFDVLKNKTINKENFIEPFLHYCENNSIPLFCIDLDYTFRGTTESLEERLKSNVNWIPIEYILNNEKSDFTKKISNDFQNLIKNLKKNMPSDVFSYKGISLWSVIKPVMDDILLEPYFPTYFHLIENIETFLKKTKPSVIIQTYEAGPYAKAIELVAKKLKIKTIAIQHGLILRDTPDYFFNQIRTDQIPLGNIIPDITLVFGEYYKELLVEKSAYPKKNIEIFGHPEYFNVNEIKSKINKQKLQSKFGWTKKFVILVSLSFRFFDIPNSPDRIILNIIYNEFKNDNDLIVLVRPHPGDKFTKDILKKEFPSENFHLSESSLIEDIILSDIVITLPISTVSTETIIFNKPILFPDIIQQNQLKIDPIFKILTDNNLAIILDKNNIIKRIKILKEKKSLIDLDNFEREKIIRYVCDFKLKPKIENYLRKEG
jgi:hypothetical protein